MPEAVLEHSLGLPSSEGEDDEEETEDSQVASATEKVRLALLAASCGYAWLPELTAMLVQYSARSRRLRSKLMEFGWSGTQFTYPPNLAALLHHLERMRSQAPNHESQYRIIEKLGQGAYGKVYKAVVRNSPDVFAIKKIKIQYEDEGVPGTAIREISLLKQCDHPNVIKLHDVFSKPHALFLVFEFMDMDLRAYIKGHGRFTDGSLLKGAAFQIIMGIEFCHGHSILHRDLKPQNVLIDVATHRLKLADFGLARAFSVPLRAYTHEVVTLWYRAPEILLGMRTYATPADIWSVGCIIAEMATSQALFPGDSEIDTIFKIFRLKGTPSDDMWPGVTELRDFNKEFPKWHGTEYEEVRANQVALGDLGVLVVAECLRYDPLQRPSASMLLSNVYFNGVGAGG